jgi:uncharacterized protein YcbK (DUF882 family)
MAYLHRRAFLRASSVVALSAASSFAFPAFAKVAAPAVIGTKNIDCRTLVMNNIHNGEKLKSDYWVEGSYIPEELAHVNKFLRDYRNNKVLPIDPKLLDFLHQLDDAVDRGSRSFAGTARPRPTSGCASIHRASPSTVCT